MAASLLAFVLLAASVDPRLDEALRLLAEVHDAAGEPIGAEYARVPDALGLSLDVGDLPPNASGRYESARRTVTIAESLLTGDQRFVATVLAHELRHAIDIDEVAVGTREPDCLELEARGFEIQARIARAFWPDELPGSTDAERGLAGIVQIYEESGIDGIRALLAGHERYQQSCVVTGGVRWNAGVSASRAASGRQRE
jgi:hypothetical protein